MNIDTTGIEYIVKKVMAEIDSKEETDKPQKDALREEMLIKENMEMICQKAIDETRVGNYEHKLIKHKLAVDKTPGPENLVVDAFTGDDGLTLI